MLSDKVQNQSQNFSRGGASNLHLLDAQHEVISKSSKTSGKSIYVVRSLTCNDDNCVHYCPVAYLLKSFNDAVNGEEVDEKAKNPVVQQKGRFKVTSESVEMEKVNIQVSMCVLFFNIYLKMVVSFV